MHSRATIAALVFAVSACAGSNEENRPAQAVGESHNTPQTSAGTQQQRPPMAMQGNESEDESQSQHGRNQGQMNPQDPSPYGQGQTTDQNGSMGTNPPPVPPNEQKVEQFGDAQIVGLLEVAHKGEIEEAKVAGPLPHDRIER